MKSEKEYVMSTFSAWPEIIQQAFYDTWIYDNGCYLEEVDRFTQQWGSLDSEAFLRALSKGQGKERIFALFALGLQNLPGIVELFFPFLESDRPEERWASAISLGRLRQEQVFQLLQDLLLESTQDYLEVTEINDTYA
jgi:HEAT repeats